MKIKIQTASGPTEKNHSVLPYPFFIEDECGKIGRQDFWRGRPEQLLGFVKSSISYKVILTQGEFWREPEKSLGLYPVFATSKKEGNEIYTLKQKVCAVQSFS